jgi:hypothetical protein
MTDNDPYSPFAPAVPKTPEAVRAGLDPDQQEEFDVYYQRDPVDAMDRWWPVAQTQAKGPGTRERIEAVLAAMDAGEPIDTVPAFLDDEDT